MSDMQRKAVVIWIPEGLEFTDLVLCCDPQTDRIEFNVAIVDTLAKMSAAM